MLFKVIEDDKALFTFSTSNGYGYISYEKGYNDLYAINKISTHQSDTIGIFDYEDDSLLVVGPFENIIVETVSHRREINRSDNLLIFKDHFNRDDITNIRIDGYNSTILFKEQVIDYDSTNIIIIKGVAIIIIGLILSLLLTISRNRKPKASDTTDGMYEQLNYMKK